MRTSIEPLNKYLYRHAVEKWHPGSDVPLSYFPPERRKGIPVYAGMTFMFEWILVQSFPISTTQL